MDKKAIEILTKDFKYYEDGFRTSTPEKFEYAKSKGLMFDKIQITHNSAIHELFEVFEEIEEEKVINNFFASLSTRRLDLRSGISAYMIAKNFPNHNFIHSKEHSCCPICGDYGYNSIPLYDLNIVNHFRFKNGAFLPMNYSPIHLTFCLKQIIKEETLTPTNTDIQIFDEVIDLIESSSIEATPTDLLKTLSEVKSFKSNSSERRFFLETLSIIGVLQPKGHKGFRNKFTDFSESQKRANGASKNNWGYPIRWWKGSDGVNSKRIENMKNKVENKV